MSGLAGQMHLEGLDADVVHRVAVDVDGAAVDGLLADALEDVGEAVVEAADVGLAVVAFDAVVGHLGDVVAVDVDVAAVLGRAPVVFAEGVDAVREARDAVEADDVAGAGDLESARVFNPLGARPGAGAGEDVVGEEMVFGVGLALGRRKAVVDVVDIAAAHHEPLGAVGDDAIFDVVRLRSLRARRPWCR